jgi:hypothetical protein
MRKIFCTVPAPLRFRCSRLIMVLSSVAISSFALALSHAALAGVSIDFVTSSRIHIEGKPDSSGRHTKTIRIDGPRFQLLSDIGRGAQKRIDETSLDDGATTFFPGERSVTQTPLISDAASAGGPGGLFSPMKAWVEDDNMTISEPQPGPMLLGMPTQIYTVDHSYVTVGQIAFVYTRRFPTTARHVITTANLVTPDGLAISPAAVRVSLSRGSYRVLAHHPEAFRGFPLRIEAHLAQHSEAFQGAPLWVNGRLVNGEGATGDMVVDFQFEAVRISDWSWREKAVNK